MILYSLTSAFICLDPTSSRFICDSNIWKVEFIVLGTFNYDVCYPGNLRLN